MDTLRMWAEQSEKGLPPPSPLEKEPRGECPCAILLIRQRSALFQVSLLGDDNQLRRWFSYGRASYPRAS
jgi:hypothetical protein